MPKVKEPRSSLHKGLILLDRLVEAVKASIQISVRVTQARLLDPKLLPVTGQEQAKRLVKLSQ